MPITDVYFYKDDDGSVPVLDWLNELRSRNQRAFKKCFGLVRLLEELGHELRRPRSDYLRDGVYELRTEVGNVNYRLLYGFVGKDAAVLACGFTKERTVPDQEIERAMTYIEKYKAAPDKHRFDYEEEETDG